MAGHSKWANIKHKKGRTDALRAKVFTKHIRAITVAARAGDPDPDANAALRLAVDKAKSANVPKDTITNAIKRAHRDLDSANIETILYEGYGTNGVAVMVECMTDNRNRTVGEVRHAFSKCGGNLGTSGSVAYLFTKQGLIGFPPEIDEDKIMEIALEAGADDVAVDDEGSIEVSTTPEQFTAVKDAFDSKNIEPDRAELTQVASTEIELDKKGAEAMMRLLEMLEDLDDVQEVYSNANIPDEILKDMT